MQFAPHRAYSFLSEKTLIDKGGKKKMSVASLESLAIPLKYETFVQTVNKIDAGYT